MHPPHPKKSTTPSDQPIKHPPNTKGLITPSKHPTPPPPQPSATALFAHGALSAHTTLFSANHHIFRDNTTFAYAIILTKTDCHINRNERIHLTLYASNSLPSTYATHMRWSGTGGLPENRTPAPLGSDFVTAFRAFREVFEVKTGCAWGERGGAVKGEEGEVEERGKERGVKSKAVGKKMGGGRSDAGVKKSGSFWRQKAKAKAEMAVMVLQKQEEDKRLAEERWRREPFRYKMPEEGLPQGAMPW